MVCNIKSTLRPRGSLFKLKIENGKWKIAVGQTVCNVKKHIMPERSIAIVRTILQGRSLDARTASRRTQFVQIVCKYPKTYYARAEVYLN